MDLFLKGIPVENNKQTGEINNKWEVELSDLKFKMNERKRNTCVPVDPNLAKKCKMNKTTKQVGNFPLYY